jgi:rhamnogalacturonyl hydrolase YesR
MTNSKTYTQQYQETQAVINEFHEACQLGHPHGWAYEAGWLQSALARVIMTLPRAQREDELALLRRQAREIEAVHVVSNLVKE